MAYDLGTARGKIELEYEGRDEVDKAQRDIDGVGKRSEKTDKSLGHLSTTLKGLFTGVKLTVLATAMSSAAIQAANFAIQIAGIIPQLVSIASLSSALPAIYVGLAATVGVLKAVFAGLGDTIKLAFDPKKAAQFEEALKELSPEAQKFARAIQTSVPFLKQYQQQLQESFFRASFLTGQVPRLMKALEGMRPTLVGLAGDFGEAARKMSNFALSADSLDFITNSIKATRAAFSEASTAMIPVLTGLRAVGSVGLPLFTRLGEVIGIVGTRFGKWLSQIAASGQLQEWINVAIETLTTLGDIAKNVGAILLAVLKAAGDSGGGLLNTIKAITGQFAAFLTSAEGSAAIRDLFASITQVAKQLAPVLTTLVGALAKALAPALMRIATEVGPILLDVVQRLAPAFGPLAKAIADLVIAIAPLLVPAAELLSLLAQLASTVVTGLVSELGPLIKVLSGALLKTFEQLAPVVSELARTALPILAESGAKLAEAFVPMIPAIVEITQALAEGLIPVLPDLVQAMVSLVPIVVEMMNSFVELWDSGLNKIVDVLPLLIRLLVLLLPALNMPVQAALALVIAAVKLFAALNNAGNAIKTFASNLLGNFINALKQTWQTVKTVGQQIIDWFQALPSRLLSAVQAFPGLILNFFDSALKGLATLIGTAAGVLVGIFVKLPVRIWNALQNLPVLVFNLVNKTMANAKALVLSGINGIINFFKTTGSRAKSALSNLGPNLVAIGRNAFNSFRSAVVSGTNNLISYIRGIPGRARSALGNVGSLLYNAGRSIVSGLYNGVVSMAGRVLDYVRGLANRIKDAFNNALSIFSPSKVMMESGVNIDEGLIAGMKKKLSEVGRTATALANMVIAPTVTLPATTVGNLAMAGVTAPAASSTVGGTGAQSTPSQFGPYNLTIDNEVISSFMVNAITGNPEAVSKAAKEGNRVGVWKGSGRKGA